MKPPFCATRFEESFGFFSCLISDEIRHPRWGMGRIEMRRFGLTGNCRISRKVIRHYHILGTLQRGKSIVASARIDWRRTHQSSSNRMSRRASGSSPNSSLMRFVAPKELQSILNDFSRTEFLKRKLYSYPPLPVLLIYPYFARQRSNTFCPVFSPIPFTATS